MVLLSCDRASAIVTARPEYAKAASHPCTDSLRGTPRNSRRATSRCHAARSPHPAPRKAPHPARPGSTASGWADAASRLYTVSEGQATRPSFGAGLYLAPRLVHAPVVNSALASFLPLRFNPRDTTSASYAITPAHGFHGETPSAAGIARWSAARHRSPDEGDALLYACAQVNVMPMEPMGSTDDADAGRTGDPAGTGHEPRARSHAASAPPPVPPYQTPTDERSPLVMRRTVLRGVATTALIVATGLAAPVQALAGDASGSDVVVVDEPDTSGLDSTWTTALLGIPIFGAIQSVEQVPGRLIPGFPALPTLPSL